jgi:two-component system chemotaxis response regulator CheB
MAENFGSGRLFEKYTALAEEAEHAVWVLGNRLSEAYRNEGERGAG